MNAGLLFGGWAVAAIAMFAAWLWQKRTRNAAVVDFVWTVCTGATAITFAVLAGGPIERRGLIAALFAGWTLRLGGHLLPRLFQREEDRRYQDLREKWGPTANRRFLWFFQSQAIAAPLFAATAGVAADARGALSAWDAAGFMLGAIALWGEWRADHELSRFRAAEANRGRVCDVGLWRFSRHPNYFFEWLFWCGFVPLAASSPWWPLTLGPPAAMYYFLNFVTGIPPAETQSLASRGDAYREYQRRTSAFFPWPPKSRR